MATNNQILRYAISGSGTSAVTTAYHYLRDLAVAIGKKEAAAMFCGGDWRLAVKSAKNRLVLHSPQLSMELSEKAAKDTDTLPSGVSAEIVSRVSTVDKDWDGDIVHPEGLIFDQKAPLLWMHAQNMPIGTFRGIVEQDEEKAVCKYHTAETQLALDAVKLFKIGALRNSIGFKTLEANPLGFVDGANGKQVPTGFDIKRAVVLENSAVAVPANPNAEVLRVYAKQYDAIWDEASKKSFKHPVVKQYAAAVYEKRPSVFKGATLETKEIKLEKAAPVDADAEKSMNWGTEDYMDDSHEQDIENVHRNVKGYLCAKGECDQDHTPAVMATFKDKAYVAMRKWTGDGYQKKTYEVTHSKKDGKCCIDSHKSVKFAHTPIDDMQIQKWMAIDGITTKGGVDTTKPTEQVANPLTIKQVLASVLIGEPSQDEIDFVIKTADILRERAALADFAGR